MADEEKVCENTDPVFEDLLEFLKREHGFDFTGYKRKGLTRRISKRMKLVGIDGFDRYRSYLVAEPDELTRLFSAVLINVTGFFRDPDAWQKVAEDIIPQILERKRAGEPVRVWSAGCSTGEEAYALAILLAEALGWDTLEARVTIHATDWDEEALASARLASYRESAVEDIPQYLRDRYFDRAGARFVVRPELRAPVLFERSDLTQAAPFSRLDLIVCRNTLMYFNTETQNRILSRFHSALDASGFLFLGRAEMLLGRGGLFAPADLRARIFCKVPRGALSARKAGMRARHPAKADSRKTPRADRRDPPPNPGKQP